MRRRSPILLVACAAALWSSSAAVAQESAPAVEAPLAAEQPPPVAEPAPPAPAPEPAPPVEPPPVAEPAPAAPVPAAEPVPALVRSRTQSTSRTRARSSVRPRAPNQEQADGELSYYGGRVTVGAVPPATCPDTNLCEGDPPRADYEVNDLEVRTQRGEPALLRVRSARSRGPAGERRIDVDIELRTSDGVLRDGRLVLRPGDDLLDRRTYEGTGLESAFADVARALRELTSDGGVLDSLAIVFGEGFLQGELVATAGIATAEDTDVVYARFRGEPPPNFRPRPQPTPPPSAAPRPLPGGGGGGGGDDDLSDDALAALGPRPVNVTGAAGAIVDLAGGVAGALVVGSCEALGGVNCEGGEALPFTLDALTSVLFVDAAGWGQVSVRCPAGYDGVTGVLRVDSEIHLGEPFRRLATDVRFRCDEPSVVVRVRLLPEVRERLDAGETIVAQITASVTGPEALAARDVDASVSVRLRSRERPSG